MKLTDIKCKSAKPKPDKAYKLFDGGGLYLEVMPNGNKLWRLKYYYLGKEKRITAITNYGVLVLPLSIEEFFSTDFGAVLTFSLSSIK